MKTNDRVRIPFVFAADRPQLSPPEGCPVIAHIVVNVESWDFAKPMPRAMLPAPSGVTRVPDVPNFAWAEYGLRCGLPRLMQVLREAGVPVSACMNAAVVDDYPRVAEAIGDAAWEVVGHGYRQEVLEPGHAAETIASSLDTLEGFYGIRPRGWLSPGLQETEETPELLVEAGVEYLFDWVLDDLPTWLHTDRGRLLALPYTLELNDSVLFAVERQASLELYRRFEDALSAFERELSVNPRVVTIALHPHLTGVAHRVGYVTKVLETLQARNDVVFMVGEAIRDWYVAAESASAGTQQ